MEMKIYFTLDFVVFRILYLQNLFGGLLALRLSFLIRSENMAPCTICVKSGRECEAGTAVRCASCLKKKVKCDGESDIPRKFCSRLNFLG